MPPWRRVNADYLRDGPGDFTNAGHFLVLTGVDKNGDIILQDPNSVKRTKQHWDVQKLMNQMKNLWAYSC